MSEKVGKGKAGCCGQHCLHLYKRQGRDRRGGGNSNQSEHGENKEENEKVSLPLLGHL